MAHDRSSGTHERFRPGRQLRAATFGHTLEWFDFLAYQYLAVYFAAQIFGGEEGIGSLLEAFGTFAVGFLARPVGSLIIGVYADRYGRKPAVVMTMSMMAVGSLLLGLCPTYAQAGALAPVILVVARLLQGFSAGGEYPSASAFLIESAPPGRRGLFSSFMFVASSSSKLLTLGIIALLSLFLDKEQMYDFGWRVPFVLGAVLAVVGWWIRRNTSETADVAGINERSARPTLFAGLRRYPRYSLQLFFLVAAITGGQYFWGTYITTLFQIRNGASQQVAFVASIVSLVVYIAVQPLVGSLSDRFGRRPWLIVFCVGSGLVAVPLMSLSSPAVGVLITVQTVGLLFMAFGTSILSAVMVEMFPAHARVAGLGFAYSMSVVVFGGTIPLIATALQGAGHPMAIGWYLVALCVMSLVSVLTIRETSTVDLQTGTGVSEAAAPDPSRPV
ncbi:MFS transporter [Pseudonocardia halophobica]|uniref:MFS transporter n=1 Tax=Pseudonocardia halophobica TaxID=29401 RepID=A0A9W6L1T9_9PSEU|nr:MFS transporter [Pseudonocardia halophobica]GLL10640.1 MFS transporter [Pseudonocardia halophobica]